MKNQHIAQLEAHLEQLIEGGFTRLFGRKIHAQDIALQLARAMEDNVRMGDDRDSRPFAPDQYMIYTHPSVQKTLMERHPSLGKVLGEHMVELAKEAGYRLNDTPTMKFLADAHLERGEVVITANHSSIANSTAAMQRIEAVRVEMPTNPQLIVDQQLPIDLQGHIINIGRNRDNQIVLDDPHVSRQHVQLRLRDGAYMLFDIDSNAGTLVNGIKVKEHRLKSGDVIRVGSTQMIYFEDDNSDFDVTSALE